MLLMAFWPLLIPLAMAQDGGPTLPEGTPWWGVLLAMLVTFITGGGLATLVRQLQTKPGPSPAELQAQQERDEARARAETAEAALAQQAEATQEAARVQAMVEQITAAVREQLTAERHHIAELQPGEVDRLATALDGHRQVLERTLERLDREQNRAAG